jgi:DNA polymerase IV
MLGRASGRHLHALAHNVDPRPVEVGRRRRSMGAQRAFGRHSLAARSPRELDTVLAGLVDRVTRRLRAADRVGRTVTVRLRFDDFGRATRSHTLPEATAETRPVLDAARRLLHDARPLVRDRGLTLVGVAVANLDDAAAVQLALPFEARSGRALDAAVDAVRDRFGTAAVTRAALLKGGEGLAVPLLPD